MSSHNINPKLIVILGPTSSGKSELAVQIARQFNGEIISADSRQVYKGMNIGTGKVVRDKIFNFQFSIFKKNSKFKIQKNAYFYKGIEHYLLDAASPKRRFTVAQYKKMALAAIKKIQKKGKVPIICGGTGFYIQAVVDNISIPEVTPDFKLRSRLEKKTAEQLFLELKKRDPNRAKNIDRYNKRRLIRALEIVYKTGQPVPKLQSQPTFNVLFIGVKKSPQELQKLIHKRLIKRLKQGMVKEVLNLRKSGLSWHRLESFGLEYRWIARYLQNKVSFVEMVNYLQKDSEHYAKRQMAWFKKYPGGKIHWIINKKQTRELIKIFLK